MLFTSVSIPTVSKQHLPKSSKIPNWDAWVKSVNDSSMLYHLPTILNVCNPEI